MNFGVISYPLIQLFATVSVALLAGFLVQEIGWRILQRITRRFSATGALVRSTAQPMRVVVPLLFMQFSLLATTIETSYLERLIHLCGLALMAALTWLVTRCIAGGADTIVALRPLGVADNLEARRIQTQTRVLERSLKLFAILIGVALMLMTFPGIRTLGTSLLASAGLAGIVAGVAARPVLSNLIAGLQIALSQPIRLDDVLVVEGEWGRVEEITGAFVVIRIWDERRLVVPLQWFIEHPFQNWTRTTSEIIGTVFLWVDYRMPLAPLRTELSRLCAAAEEWDQRICLLQVTEAGNSAMQLRALVTSASSDRNWDLRCKVREGLLDFMQKNYPHYLPQIRAEFQRAQSTAAN